MCVVDILMIVIFEHTIFALWLTNVGHSTSIWIEKNVFIVFS